VLLPKTKNKSQIEGVKNKVLGRIFGTVREAVTGVRKRGIIKIFIICKLRSTTDHCGSRCKG
jgi:hypothetical protein